MARKYLLLGCFMLAGCSTPTIAPNFGEADCKHKVYVLEEGLEASLNLTESLLRSDIIDVDEASDVLEKLEVADLGLNRAAPLCNVDERTALALLLEIKNSLDEVDQILSEAE